MEEQLRQHRAARTATWAAWGGDLHPNPAYPGPTYRYALWREWQHAAPYLLVIGLNPSTANETENDPTIRRCIDFAKRWGYGALCMANLFAYRATDPREMKAVAEPVGPGNDAWLLQLASGAGRVLAAWGAHGGHLNRDRHVGELLRGVPLSALRVTYSGYPGHPLYLPAASIPEPYDVAGRR